MWLHIGFGAIGKNLITPFLCENKIDFTVKDRNQKPGDSISYKINYFDGTTSEEYVANFFDESKSEDIKIISTSIMPENIKHVKDFIESISKKSKEKIILIPFENSHLAVDELKTFENVIVFESVIDRIVSKDKNDVEIIETFKNIKIDEKINKYVNVSKDNTSNNIEQEHLIKFYLVNGMHATFAYLASERNDDTLENILNDDEVVEQVKDAYFKFMHKNISQDVNYLKDYIDKSVLRFKETIGDPTKRIGRNPTLKTVTTERMAPIYQNNKTLWQKIVSGSKKI